MNANPIVLDFGSESIKAGYANQVPDAEEPRIITPSLVYAHPKGVIAETASKPGAIRRVVNRGSHTGIEPTDAMLHYLLYEQLGWVPGEEGSVLFVEPLFVGKSEREVLTQLLFEGYNVSGLYLHDAAALCMYAAGKLAGVSIDIGHGKIDIAAVSEGVTQAPGAARMGFAGEQLTRLLGETLARQQQGLRPLNLMQLGALKVQCCRAAESAEALTQLLANPLQWQEKEQQQRRQQAALHINPQQQGAAGGAGSSSDPHQQQQQPEEDGQQQRDQQLPPLGKPQQYTLPDGTTITITTEGAQTAEVLFRPPTSTSTSTTTASAGPNSSFPSGPSLVDCIIDCVNELPDQSLRRSVLDGVLLSGGGACIPGIHERLAHELAAQLPTGLAPKMSYVPEYMQQATPQYTAWLGGAIMAKMVAYNSHFMIKAEYEELGPSAVHRKCA